MIVDGDISEPEFIAYYVKSDRIIAASVCKRDHQTCAFLELMRMNVVPKPNELRGGKVALVSLLSTKAPRTECP